MGKWSNSLLNQDGVSRIAEGMRKGAVGLLAGRLPPEAASWPRKKLKNWSEGRPDLLWAWLSDRLLLLALRMPEDKPFAEDKLARTELELRRIVGEPTGASAPVGFGFAWVAARPQHRYTEQQLLDEILEASALAGKSLTEETAKPAKPGREHRADESWNPETSGMTIGKLATSIATMAPDARVSAAAEWFESQPDSHSIVVETGGTPQGLITRERLNGMLASKFGVPLYWNRTIDKIMVENPLVADVHSPVEAVARRAMNRPDSQLYDTVIVTEHGRCLGGVTVKVLLESFASLQAEAARRVNPLTGLPGGDSIRREIEALVRLKKPFSVYYADLDYFKWFNDSYGYSAGDDMIKYTASVLGSVLGDSEEETRSFLGHIGGDDFIAISDRADADACCRSFIERFHAGVDAFYGSSRPEIVLNRHGGTVEQPGVSLSIAVIRWDGSRAVSHEQLSQWAAAYKKIAKNKPGSSYAIYEASFGDML
ncbi:diguanylate cyclase domain-containing protein [Cohnella thailandensis]|uniref:Diguanylate cyclase n=1 Tax=Cohnella thailandensis TaxID=557557 RepID=A0A841SMC8_9BACL|nr:diguanylate cyclase [Cohnella thailandensis]MBB6633084.1 diguanylate cyclase [Cohnella thailandensis]MBP1975221.1 diguanylate cyclase (GGDEF)-like protein [Cohnella thailandensis]